MYKLLLCWRYLRTRWIALASIVSVTLGVATLIVVNSVMDGFTEEMHDRMHGILSDIVVQSVSMGGIADPEGYEKVIRETLGNRMEGMTTVITVPAMMTFNFRGISHTQQINLIGIDTNTYASVSDFSEYLQHPENRKLLEFSLREDGYTQVREGVERSGWEYRRGMARLKKQIAEQTERSNQLRHRLQQLEKREMGDVPYEPLQPSTTSVALSPANPATPIDAAPSDASQGPTIYGSNTGSFAFDPETQTNTGIILGIGIGSVRRPDVDGKIDDYFVILPGDDITVTVPGAGTPPKAIDGLFTVVDFYKSKMSEYDSTFAFVPIEKLQQLRGMIDPVTGAKAVSSMQIKLRKGTDLDQARDELRYVFPPELSMVRVESWRDSQGPLLAAVQMETTILNILLFMIIAVAGFGILATFFMIVVEKTRDIGVLKALGAPGSGIASIFLAYGLLLGAVGAGAGALIGLVFVWNINSVAKIIEWITGREVFDPTVYYFTTIPTIVHPWMVVWVVLGAMLIAVLASVLPSLRAARMHPVEALRYE